MNQIAWKMPTVHMKMKKMLPLVTMIVLKVMLNEADATNDKKPVSNSHVALKEFYHDWCEAEVLASQHKCHATKARIIALWLWLEKCRDMDAPENVCSVTLCRRGFRWQSKTYAIYEVVSSEEPQSCLLLLGVFSERWWRDKTVKAKLVACGFEVRTHVVDVVAMLLIQYYTSKIHF